MSSATAEPRFIRNGSITLSARAASEPPIRAAIASSSSMSQQPPPLPLKCRGGRQPPWSTWVAEIRNPYTYEKKWLSTFTIAEESACAHDVAAIRYFGSRVKLNFPINASLQTSSRLLLE